MTKRSLFAELSEGFQALTAEREGKVTLRKHAIDSPPAPQVTTEKLVNITQIP